MVKRIFVAILTVVLFVGNTAYAQPKSMTLYALDGRRAVVPYNDVAAWQKVGWYTEPVTVMYALDGRQIIVVKSDVEVWKNVGWYTEPGVRMYAPDGRCEVVAKANVEAWKNVGWYDYVPTETMYAPDGRQENVPLWDVAAWKNVGWYDEAGYNAVMQKDKAYPFFALDSDYYIGNIKMGMTYSEFLSAYSGRILSESSIMQEDYYGYSFNVELDGAQLTFSNYNNRNNKNSFVLRYFYTESSKWNFARGIKVGAKVTDVYSRLPYTGDYYDLSDTGRYAFDKNLRKLNSIEWDKEIYAFVISDPYTMLFVGYFRTDAHGGLLKYTQRAGYIDSISMYL